ncbi:MAG: efflux RND transporter periplasmic adaptor subunit, partial [Phycisphaerae bacterium]
MSHESQRRRITLVATALTCLLAGLIVGGAAIHRQWQGRLSDEDFLKGCLSRLSGGPASAGPRPAPAALVRVSLASVEEIQPETPVVGRLREVREASVASEVTGTVVAMDVEEGSAVTGGQTVLVQVDDTWTRLAIDQQKAKIEAIEAQLRKDEANLERIMQSLDRKVATPKEHGDQLATAEQTRAQLKEARANLEDLQEKFHRLRIVAPFDGWVTRKHTELGERLSLGSPVVDIVSRGTIYAEVNVPESMINRLAPGMSVPVRVDPLDRTVTGNLATINPYGATASRTYPVRIALDDGRGELKIGMSVTAVMPAGKRSRQTMVAKDAVLIHPDGSTVWAVVADANEQLLAQPVPVEVV